MLINNKDKRRFRVALSFAGEKREYVKDVAQYLSEKLGGEATILYDKYHENEFARFKLDGYLPALYGQDSDLIAVFLCEDYDAKRWTGLEWQEIEKLKGRDDYWRVMPHKFAQSESAKLEPTDSYIYIEQHRSPMTTAKGILERLRSNDQLLADSNGGALSGPGLYDKEPALGDHQNHSRHDDEDFLSDDEVIAKQQAAITQLLDKPELSPLKKAMAAVLGVGNAEQKAQELASEWVDVAADKGIATLLEYAIDVAGEVVKNGYHHERWQGLEALLGCSLRLSAFIRQQGWHSSSTTGVMISKFKSSAAFEAALADRYDLSPRYEYDADNQTVRGKFGRHLQKSDLRSWEKRPESRVGTTVRETGWIPDEVAKETVQVVHKMVTTKQAQGPLDDFEKRKLNRTLKTRRNIHFQELHRVEASTALEQSHPLCDEQVCEALKNQLPELPVINFAAVVPEAQEAEIASLVEDFYLLLSRHR